MKLLKALDAGFTAFCNELWLPTFGFHIFDDPADALEDVPVELAGSLSAPGDGPEAEHSPEASASGQPNHNSTAACLVGAEVRWHRATLTQDWDYRCVCGEVFPFVSDWREHLGEKIADALVK